MSGGSNHKQVQTFADWIGIGAQNAKTKII